jgi:hypothetical protein
MTEAWQVEQKAFAQRELSGVDYVYVWADRINVNVRPEEAGARRPERRVSGGHRVVGGPAARLQTPRYAGAGAGRSATTRWGSGARCARCSPRPVSSGVGSIRSLMCLPRCRNPRTPARRKPYPRSRMLRTKPTPSTRSRGSRRPTARSNPRRSPRSPATSTSCWRSMTSRPSIGCTFAPQIRIYTYADLFDDELDNIAAVLDSLDDLSRAT